MKSSRRGKNISRVEVHGVSKQGIWLYVNGEEFFLPYRSYPWFRNATIAQIYNVKFLFGYHLRWPDLDIDLELDALKHPEKYPLIYRQESVPLAKAGESKSEKYGKRK